MNFLIFVLDSVCSSSSLPPSRFAPLFFVLVRVSRAGTTRVNEVRVVHGPRSRHAVLARHDTASLSCQLVSCRIVSCLVVFVSCSVVWPIWTSILLPLVVKRLPDPWNLNVQALHCWLFVRPDVSEWGFSARCSALSRNEYAVCNKKY
jgi:hypothetical protein